MAGTQNSVDIIFAIKNVGWFPPFSHLILSHCLLLLMVPQHLHIFLKIEHVIRVFLDLSCFLS